MNKLDDLFGTISIHIFDDQVRGTAVCLLKDSFRNLYYNSIVTRIPFVYLTSPPFSGSTLFSFLVNTHPQIATVGEMTGLVKSKDPETYRCSCGQLIRKCGFWLQVAEQMTSRQFAFDPGFFDTRIRLGNSNLAQRILSNSLKSSVLEHLRSRALKLWPRQHQRLQYLLDRNKALAASILQVTGRPVFFDASKNPMAIQHLSSQPDIDLRVVHLARDVRGTSLSRRTNGRETNWRRAVNDWVRANRTIERQLRTLSPNRWIRIRYEDLCRAPEVTLNRFYEFCGVVPHGLPQTFDSVEHHIVGNRMRLAGAGQIRLNESWRRVLTLDEQACAEKLAGAIQARYGYPEMSATDIES
jgi:hypothetical protein